MSIMIGDTKYPTLMIVASLVMVSFSGCTGLGSNVPNAKISADQTEINLGETVNFDARAVSYTHLTLPTNSWV